MKKLIWILVLILISCSSKENEVENIEFMSYNWSVEIPVNKAKPKFKTECEIYSVLNINGNNKTYFLNYEPNKVEEYFESTVDKKIIDSLIHYSNKLSENSRSEIKYDSNIGCIKAPPILRVKINYKNKTSKSYYYNFIQNDKEYSSIKKLYTELRINRIEENYRKTKMNSDLINRKNIFIKWTSNEDTLNFPKPRKLNFEPQG
ncbi:MULTISPECIES: hypothetical protein [unclassified Flavobacterium]|uniref:hypothetical protein n=1 Tax=unclassified Flavobacterium TaxID=196869 RepID=UPI003F8F4213